MSLKKKKKVDLEKQKANLQFTILKVTKLDTTWNHKCPLLKTQLVKNLLLLPSGLFRPSQILISSTAVQHIQSNRRQQSTPQQTEKSFINYQGIVIV
jgi:hypothetical protein